MVCVMVGGGGSNPIFPHGEKWGKMGKKVYGKRGKSIHFPLFPYTFFPWGKMGKDTIFPWAKMGLDPPPPPNGAQLTLMALGDRYIEAKIISGSTTYLGRNAFIPRIKLIPSDFCNSFKFQRTQFAMRLDYLKSLTTIFIDEASIISLNTLKAIDLTLFSNP